MTSTRKVTALFDDIAGNMLQFFDGWDTHVPYQGEKGGIRERRVRDFLASHLPARFGVGSGHIIDRHGQVSLQEDIVVYDRVNGPVLSIDQNYQVFPCEMVHAVIEVKSRLDTKAVEECIDHNRILRSLDRRDHRGEPLGPIMFFVFSYDPYDSASEQPALWARRKFREVAQSGGDDMLFPTTVMSLKHKYVIQNNGHRLVTYTYDSGVLLDFFEILSHRMTHVKTVRPMLFSLYGWNKGMMTEYDEEGNEIPIIGQMFVGKGWQKR